MSGPLPQPYVGLLPYEDKDADWFFGRSVECDLVVANLMSSRLTLLYGASGVGKSSIIRAGVIHQLNEEFEEAKSSGFPLGNVLVFFKEWSVADPLASLRAAIESAFSAELGRRVESPTASLGRAVSEYLAFVPGSLLLILDQFDEYFTYHAHDTAIAHALAELANDERLRVSVLISIREDRLGNLERFKSKLPQLFSNYLRIKHLDRAAARDAIEKPIARYTRVRPGAKIAIESELVDAVLDSVSTGSVALGEAGRGAVRDEVGSTRIEAPFLQLVMTRLWREEVRQEQGTLTKATFDALGGAQRIVHSHLDDVLHQLTASERDVAARGFTYLVTPSGSKIALSASDLASFIDSDASAVESVLEALSSGERRILRTVENAGSVKRYEVFHDVLGRAVLDWCKRFRDQQALVLAAERARREYWRRMRLAGTVLLALGVIAAGLYLYMARKRSEEQARIAEILRKDESAKRQEAEAQSKESEDKRTAAENALSELTSAYKTQQQRCEDVARLSDKLASTGAEAAKYKEQLSKAQANLEAARKEADAAAKRALEANRLAADAEARARATRLYVPGPQKSAAPPVEEK